MRLSRKWRRRGPCATSRSSFGCKYNFFVFFLSLYKIVLKIICKKFFCSLRAQNFILRNRSIFAGFLPISIVTWLELVLFKKYETDLTEFACKWLHMFKNSCLFCKIAPACENSLRAMLTCSRIFAPLRICLRWVKKMLPFLGLRVEYVTREQLRAHRLLQIWLLRRASPSQCSSPQTRFFR